MEWQVKIFMKNVIIKEQLLLYIKMKNVFLEDIIQVLGYLIVNGILLQIVLYLLLNIHNIEPTKFTYKNDGYAVYNGSSYGPCFGGGHDIGIDQSDFLNKDSYANFPSSYQDILGKGKSIFTGDLNNNQKFKLKEVEVFTLSKS